MSTEISPFDKPKKELAPMDPETNLPVLPEGLFWRIGYREGREGSFYSRQVEIRRTLAAPLTSRQLLWKKFKNYFLGGDYYDSKTSKLVDYDYIRGVDRDVDEATLRGNIQETASNLYLSWQADIRKNEMRNLYDEKIVGDYPPGKL